jgi:hypothetical protein
VGDPPYNWAVKEAIVFVTWQISPGMEASPPGHLTHKKTSNLHSRSSHTHLLHLGLPHLSGWPLHPSSFSAQSITVDLDPSFPHPTFQETLLAFRTWSEPTTFHHLVAASGCRLHHLSLGVQQQPLGWPLFLLSPSPPTPNLFTIWLPVGPLKDHFGPLLKILERFPTAPRVNAMVLMTSYETSQDQFLSLL